VPEGFDQPAPPPPPQQTVEPSVEPPVEPQMGAAGGGQAPEAGVEQPKRSAWKWIVGIIVIAALGSGGYYYYITKIKTSPSSSTSSETTSTGTSSPGTSPTPSSTTKSTIENAYDNATVVTATTDKAKAVDTVLMPILQKTFTDKVKLTDASSVLTYTTNRTILAADITSVKTQLETAGYKTIDSSEKQLTMSKDASTWVITFSVGSETKATVDVTY
jgi:cytoskeletal protein RodZ